MIKDIEKDVVVVADKNERNSMIIKFIENIGDKTINFITSLYSFISFFILYIFHIFNYRNYNSKTFIKLIHQIYYTSITGLPFFLVMASIFGSLIVGAIVVSATAFNVRVQIASLIVTFVLNELSPLLTAIFISLRSGTQINKKLAHINLQNSVEIRNQIILPRIIATVLSTVSLSLIFAIIMLSSGYVFTFFLLGMDLHTYKYLIFDAISISNLIILPAKALIFGLIITLIAVYNGLNVAKKSISSRTSGIHMIVNTLLALFFLEMLSLLLIKIVL